MSLLLPGNAFGATIQGATANRSAILGGAYQSERENFVGQECMTGTAVTQGTQRSTFSFEQALSEQQASSLMGMSAGGRARFGAIEASASARFVKNSVSNRLSVSAIWMSDYLLPNRKLTAPSLTAVGEAVRQHDERWAQTCGDEYVDEIVYGARLFFTLRVDFASEEQKQAFEAEFSLSGPLYSASAKFEDASRKFSRDTRITVTAAQFGGDVSKLTDLFDATAEGEAGFHECTLGNFEGCAKVIAGAVRYATDVNSGFPSQLGVTAQPGPAILEYRTAPYSAAGIYPVNYPYLNEANAQARERLHYEFEKYLSFAVVADRLLAIKLNQPIRARIAAERDKTYQNIASILASSQVCYETPLNCFDSVKKLSLTVIDELAFLLPDFPRASFRILTVGKGVWAREESVAAMRACDYESVDIQSDVPIPECLPRLSSSPISAADTVSTVLYLEGSGLATATFFFEDVELGRVSLTSADHLNHEKVGPEWAAVVTSSNRQNPGWIDFDIRKSIRTLMNDQHPNADGIFFIVVEDVFGRRARFDVIYLRWQSRETDTPAGKVRKVVSWESRGRAWAEGTDGIALVNPSTALLLGAAPN
ncbi:MAG: hypothetical protein K8F56_13675 [Rhodocyclaceae bacterium]|nr:hypothetical protein [Rhodocyclaceae bacterium]